MYSACAVNTGGRPHLRSVARRVVAERRSELRDIKKMFLLGETPLQIALARGASADRVSSLLRGDTRGNKLTGKSTPVLFAVSQILLNSEAGKMLNPDFSASEERENDALWERWLKVLETLKYKYPGVYVVESHAFNEHTLPEYLSELANDTGVHASMLEWLEDY